MTDFPSKVTTETGSPNSQNTQQGANSLRGLASNVTTSMDMSFIRSIPSILMMAQIVSGSDGSHHPLFSHLKKKMELWV